MPLDRCCQLLFLSLERINLCVCRRKWFEGLDGANNFFDSHVCTLNQSVLAAQKTRVHASYMLVQERQ